MLQRHQFFSSSHTQSSPTHSLSLFPASRCNDFQLAEKIVQFADRMKWRATSTVFFQEQSKNEATVGNNANEWKSQRIPWLAPHARDVNGLSEIFWLFALCLPPLFVLGDVSPTAHHSTRLHSRQWYLNKILYCCLAERKIIKNNGHELNWQQSASHSLSRLFHNASEMVFGSLWLWNCFVISQNRDERERNADKKFLARKFEVRIDKWSIMASYSHGTHYVLHFTRSWNRCSVQVHAEKNLSSQSQRVAAGDNLPFCPPHISCQTYRSISALSP